MPDHYLQRPFHSDRRELPGADGLTGVETLLKLQSFEAALERKMPGATRWVRSYRPFIDSRGVWQPGAEISTTGPRPLTVRECLAKHRGRAF